MYFSSSVVERIEAKVNRKKREWAITKKKEEAKQKEKEEMPTTTLDTYFVKNNTNSE